MYGNELEYNKNRIAAPSSTIPEIITRYFALKLLLIFSL